MALNATNTNNDNALSLSFNSTLHDVSKLYTFLFTICSYASSSRVVTNVALDVLDMLEHLECKIVAATMNEKLLTSIDETVEIKCYDWRLALVTVSKSNPQLCCSAQ